MYMYTHMPCTNAHSHPSHACIFPTPVVTCSLVLWTTTEGKLGVSVVRCDDSCSAIQWPNGEHLYFCLLSFATQ